jgi:hypothetical protein
MDRRFEYVTIVWAANLLQIKRVTMNNLSLSILLRPYRVLVEIS